MRHNRMVRQIAAVLIGFAVAGGVLFIPTRGIAQSTIRVYVDGQLVNFDVPPNVIQGRVLVPLRGVFEKLGATVDYDGRTQHIVAVRAEQRVELTLGSRQARINGKPELLDVPAFTIGDRTMVPLRFVSESLGASVQWVEASRVILIGSSGGVPAQPPAAQTPPPPQPQPQGQTISGRLMAVSTGDNPRIVVRSNDKDQTIAVLPETAIYRFNAQTNAGGSAPLGSLRRGDQVSAVVNAQNQATKITATYRVSPGGRIASVNSANRTVTLTNGQTFVVLNDAEITLNGSPADWSALQNGRGARFLVVEGTNQAYAVRVATSAQAPPENIAVPRIASPANGQTIGHTFMVEGTAQPGAVLIVRAQPRLLGETKQVQTTANSDGRWSVNMNVTSLPLVTSPYVISAVEIVNGVLSDPTSIEVNIR
jgi:Copper amine oxidase N-terminal domain